MKKILFPLPRRDFDPSEAAIPWKMFTGHGYQVVFASPDGKPPMADTTMLTGRGLGLLKALFMANREARKAHEEMRISEEFQHPLRWDAIGVDDYSALHLTGGHARGVREYLESERLQNLVAAFFARRRVVGAICHGVLLVARSRQKPGGASVLQGRKTTSLPAWMENMAWYLTRLWLGNYFRTCPELSVEQEVRASLGDGGEYFTGPFSASRDDCRHLQRGFVVVDGQYVSARWPGDLHRYALAFMDLLQKQDA